MEKTLSRLDWLDAAKALGMLLVYIGHCNITGVNPYIYMFHMPLFFIISGFCWNVEKNADIDILAFAKKKFRNYAIPYFKICMVCFVVFIIPHGLKEYGFSYEYLSYLLQLVYGIFVYSRGTTEWLPNCSPVWFLTCLYCAEMIFYYIMRSRKPILYVFISGAIGFIMSLVGKWFPWNIDTAFSAIPLIYAGVILRTYWESISKVEYLMILCPLSIAMLIWGIKGVDFDGNHYDNMLSMYLCSITISLFLLSGIHTLYRRLGKLGGAFLGLAEIRFY